MKPNYWYDSGVCTSLPGQLENVTWMNFNPLPFLKNNNITVTIKNGSRWYKWFAADWTSLMIYPVDLFNDSVDNSILDAEGNECVIIVIPSIERTFYNDHIHVLHDLSKQYIYR